MFKALDKVEYDSLQLNKPKLKNKSKQTNVVKPLVDLSCVALNWNTDLDSLIEILPVHLVPKLLQIAILKEQLAAICFIIANWPLTVLKFKDIIQGEASQDYVEDKLGSIWYQVRQGLVLRSKKCRLKCLDFQGIGLQQSVCRLIVQTWPLQSLRKSQLKVKQLSRVITKAVCADSSSSMRFKDAIPKLLEAKLDHDITLCGDRIVVPRGQRLEVKLDSVSFSTCNTFFMDFMVTNCLRSVTPLFVTVNNIYIKSELVEGDSIKESLQPFVVLKGHDPQMLDGLSLRQLEEGIFYLVSKDIQKFTGLQSLDMQDCNIYLQEGVTRSRTLARSHLSRTFSCFTHLRRLDLSFNYLLGCLGEMLGALSCPLEFLSLRGCDLNEQDLTSLSQSKHSQHLRELNMSKLCQFSIYETDRISPIYLIQIMKHFPKLTVLNLSQNHLPDSGISEFCETLNQGLQEMKGLDIAGNYLQFDNQLKLTRACAKLKKMQWIRLTCTSNVFNNEDHLNNPNMEEMVSRFHNLLSSLGREDIYVDVVRLSFAILVDLIDVFD